MSCRNAGKAFPISDLVLSKTRGRSWDLELLADADTVCIFNIVGFFKFRNGYVVGFGDRGEIVALFDDVDDSLQRCSSREEQKKKQDSKGNHSECLTRDFLSLFENLPEFFPIFFTDDISNAVRFPA